MNSSFFNKSVVLFVIAILGVGTLAGCSQKITGSTVRSDMSPELETLGLTHEQHLNRDAGSQDTIMRQIHDDLDSFMLMERPSRMSRLPVP